jgi:hypothetical protein
MSANFSEAEMRALIAAQVAAGLVAGLSLGPKSPDDEVAKIAETAVTNAPPQPAGCAAFAGVERISL